LDVCHYIKDNSLYNYIMTNKLQDDVRLYTRRARKQRSAPLSFKEFNTKYGTTLPLGADSEKAVALFRKSHLKLLKANGFPIQGRMYNLYKAIAKDTSAVVAPSLKRELIPPPASAINASSTRSLGQIMKKPRVEVSQEVKKAVGEVKAKPEPYTMDHFKKDLAVWKEANPGSKLNKETQVVFFVPNQKVDNMEHFASKLTRNTGSKLETGGVFKMRSGMKKEITGMDKKVAAEIVASVTKGGKGPFFLPIACVTGASSCKC